MKSIKNGDVLTFVETKYNNVKIPKLYKVSEKVTKKDDLEQEIVPFIDYPYIRTKMLENIIRICLKNNKEDE